MSTQSGNQNVIRILIAILALFLTAFQLIFTFRGLDQPAAMDQAQIARELARGNGLTTKMLRPVDVVESSQANEEYNPLHARDTTYAPLAILADAVALKVTGMDDPKNINMTEASGNIYAPDRVIAAVSSLFFLLALVLMFFFLRDLFDELIASICVIFVTLSNLFLQFAVSGLPQMLMLCLFIGSCHALLMAVRASVAQRGAEQLQWLCASSVLMALVCLSGWLGVWPLIGLAIFIGIYFRPRGVYSLIPIAAVVLLSGWFLIRNKIWTGSLFGNAAYSIYNTFGVGEENIMRASEQSAVPFQASDFILKLLGFSLSQMDNLYANLGSIVVTPFFFLALLHSFKKPEVQAIKWATFSMWTAATIGMTLYGTHQAFSAGQLNVLFAPLMSAFGLSLVLIMLARLRMGEGEKFARNFVIFCLILISSGSFLFRLPGELRIGLWTSEKGIPQWPPYYPPALSGKLNSMTDSKKIIMSDMPWAVAWYADRHALWLPKRIEELESKIMPVLERKHTDIQGIVISPVSHSTTGMSGIYTNYGDFAPLVMEGMLLALSPKHNFRYVELFHEKEGADTPLGTWVSNTGKFNDITSLLGAQLLYYGKKETAY
ncbi:MAG: hypothetical protein LUG84_09115 [Akkermansiaceae bacterium]|nr:hypothetical protein [Akkermansiaceae bacterium]